MNRDPLIFAITAVAILAQLWALGVVLRDRRFDLLTRFGYAALVIILPIIGFFAVTRLRQKTLHAREQDLRTIRSNLRGSIRTRF